MNENDLRVKKTRASIENAFFELLAEKPLEKISVTELARRARINKGTFYLHYKDIYDLYSSILDHFFDNIIESIDFFPLFLEDTEGFLRSFTVTVSNHFEEFRMLLQKSSETRYQQQLVQKLSSKIGDACNLPHDLKNDIRLDAALNLLLYLFPKYADSPEGRKEASDVIKEIIAEFWS